MTTSPASNLDPLTRAELDKLADDWRDVYPAGRDTYMFPMLELVVSQRTSGRLSGDDALWIVMLIMSYANGQRRELDLDLPRGSDLGPIPEPFI